MGVTEAQRDQVTDWRTLRGWLGEQSRPAGIPPVPSPAPPGGLTGMLPSPGLDSALAPSPYHPQKGLAWRVHEGERKENSRKPALCTTNKQADHRGSERRQCAEAGAAGGGGAGIKACCSRKPGLGTKGWTDGLLSHSLGLA